MIARWTALLLLSGSWLFGLTYYHQANLQLWAALLVFALLLMFFSRNPVETTPQQRIGKPIQLFIYTLCAQRLTLSLYEAATAFSHQLPTPVARLLAGLARLVGIEAAFNGTEIALYTMRRVHRLAATWELLLDPVSLSLLIGGIVLLLSGTRRPWKAIGKLTAIIAAWLPLRAVLLMAILLHRTWLTDYDANLQVMELFWNPWVLTALTGIPALAAAVLISPHPPPPEAKAQPAPKSKLRTVAAGTALLLLAAAIAAAALHWEPIGKRKSGRVLVDEHHSTWEPTQRPFDTEWYGHDAGYNYACIYDYASRYYEMGRLTNAITPQALQNCDVLMLKVPTSAYAPEEIQALMHFVEHGGGIMLVGEHTDVYLTSTHLNQVARMFGFEFRNDCLFGIDSTFEQHYRPPRVPHPILQHMPPIDFAVSCSIKPFARGGRAVIRSTGLWNLPADYHASNYYPQIEDRADTRYGAFVQLWSTRHGKGRVVGFADSTIFSNFSAFEPGKAELMLGMLEWLNHSNTIGDPRNKLLAVALLLAIPALTLLRRKPLWLVMMIAATGWAAATHGIRLHHTRNMPRPTPLRDYTLFTIDRTHCGAPLSKSGFIKASPRGFGICEQWILKPGFFLSRREGADLFEGDVATFFHPDTAPTSAFVQQLSEYVSKGGTLLIFDSAINTNSTANTILRPFGLSVDQAGRAEGILQTPPGWPENIETTASRFVNGGTPFIAIDGSPVAAYTQHGKGTVYILGCGDRFNDDNMGITTDVEPTPELRRVFELEFKILRATVNNTLPSL